MTEELRAQLMGVKLTKKEKLIADFILDNFAGGVFYYLYGDCKTDSRQRFFRSSALPERWATAASWNFRGQSARHIPSG